MAPAGGARAPAHFDDGLFAADLARMSARGRIEVTAARTRMESAGVRADERRRCSAEHQSGTRLPGCVKVYVPEADGPWRIVFQVARFEDG